MRIPATILFLLISISSCLADAGQDRMDAETATAAGVSTWLHWSDLPELPADQAVAGAFIGTFEGRLIVAGGSNFPVAREDGGEKAYSTRINLLEKEPGGSYQWREAGTLPYPCAHGAAIVHGNELICLGGENTEGLTDKVFLIRYDTNTRKIIVDEQSLTLPEPRSYVSAALFSGRLYVAGGKGPDGTATSTFWSLAVDELKNRNRDKTAWRIEPTWPGPARQGTLLLKQNRGERDVLYLIGGKGNNKDYLTDCFSFDPVRQTTGPWQSIAPLPRAAYLAPAVTWGQSHLLVFGGSDGKADEWLQHTSEAPNGPSAFPNDILAYHTITNTWCVCGTMPLGIAVTTATIMDKGIVIPSGEIRPAVRASSVFRAEFNPVRTHFAFWDYIALFVYFILLGYVAYRLASWKKSSQDFMIGAKRIPWWAAALSLLATQISSIGAMSIPAKSYATDWSYFVIVGVWFLVVPIITTFYIPFFRSLNVTSAYEYLEYRFHWTVRILAMVIYSLSQIGRMAIVLYLPALALVAVTGIDPKICILIMGVICTFYTFMGGIEAVIWIDCFQAIVLIGGIFLCLCTIMFGLHGNIFTFWEVASSDSKFSFGTLKFDPTITCVWVLMIGNFFTRLGGLTADQSIVQRYLTVKSDAAAKRSLWGDVFLSIPWALLVFSFGTALYVFFKMNPLALNPTLDTDGIVPYYIAVELTTPGLAGLIIAAIFAAAMSSFDSSIHSVATIWVVDVYARFCPKSSDGSRLWLARFFTLALGVFGTVAALCLTLLDIRSLWDSFFAVTGLFIGGLTGLFVLAMFTRRTSAPAAILGVLGSASVLWYVIHQTKIHFFLYSAIGCLCCVLVGYLAGFLLPGRPEAEKYTIFRKKS